MKETSARKSLLAEGEREKMYVKKSVEAASHFKELGNSYFKQYERTKALTCYTKVKIIIPPRMQSSKYKLL